MAHTWLTTLTLFFTPSSCLYCGEQYYPCRIRVGPVVERDRNRDIVACARRCYSRGASLVVSDFPFCISSLVRLPAEIVLGRCQLILGLFAVFVTAMDMFPFLSCLLLLSFSFPVLFCSFRCARRPFRTLSSWTIFALQKTYSLFGRSCVCLLAPFFLLHVSDPVMSCMMYRHDGHDHDCTTR